MTLSTKLPTHLNAIKNSTPVYAVVGAGDLAVAKLRGIRLPRTDVRNVYGELALRGQALVTRVGGQQATKDLEDQVSNTASSAKATSTTAKKSAKSTRSSAKGTATSAKKSANAAGTATKKAAEKVGE